MQDLGFVGFRRAFIHTINGNGTYNIYYADDDVANIVENVCFIEIGSFGSGVYSRYHIGAPVWVAQGYCYEPIIVGFAGNIGSVESGTVLEVDETDDPIIKSGEMIIQATSGAHIDLTESGDVKISNLKNDSIFLSDAHQSLSFSSQQHYNINDSGYTIEGRVKRFHPSYLPGQATAAGITPVFVDLISDPEADSFTIDIARDPSQKSSSMNRDRGVAKVMRNPSFAEKREAILEFADSFFVRDIQTESGLVNEFPKTLKEMNGFLPIRRGYGKDEQTFDNLRHSSRTNVLKLDSNVIIERIQGTLVDIFGNVLDLNYNKLNMPKISETGKNSIEAAHSLLNRSVAYHFQVNSRNIITDTSTGSGKFTFDIDKEGQFKLNIPRSSSSGTIPTISSFTKNDTSIESRIDVNNTQLSKSNISTHSGGNAGTAFHDMTLVGDRMIRHTIKSLNPIREHSNTSSIQSKGDTPNIEFLITDTTPISKIPSYTTTVSVQAGPPPITSEITSKNSGGRSGLMNLEGSLEMSIGKDDADGKSLTLDTAGSLIGWLGIDSKKRSAVVNADGEMLLNIGNYIVDKDNKPVFNQGLLSIRVNLVDEQDPKITLQPEKVGDNKATSDHIIYFGPKGIIISSGNGTPIVIRSSGDLSLEAAGTLDMKAKEIRMDSGYLRRVSPKKGDI